MYFMCADMFIFLDYSFLVKWHELAIFGAYLN